LLFGLRNVTAVKPIANTSGLTGSITGASICLLDYILSVWCIVPALCHLTRAWVAKKTPPGVICGAHEGTREQG